jgi:hypothetical protein
MSAQQIEYSIAHLNLLCSILLLYRAFSFRSLIKTIRVKVFLCATYTASRAPAVIAVLFRRMNRYVGNLSPRSAFGTSRHFVARQHLVAIGAQRTLGEQYQSSTIHGGGPTDLPDRQFEEFSVWPASH